MKKREVIILLFISLLLMLSSCYGEFIYGHDIDGETLQEVADTLYGEGFYFFNPGENFVRDHFWVHSDCLSPRKKDVKYLTYRLSYFDPSIETKTILINMYHHSAASTSVTPSGDETAEMIFYGEDRGQTFRVRKISSNKVVVLVFDDGARQYSIFVSIDEKYETDEALFEAQKTRLIEIFKTRYILPKSK